MNKQETEEAIENLVQILTEKGVKITFAPDSVNAYFPVLNEIVVNSKQNYSSRYYTILHETGHFLLRQQSDFSSKYLLDHSHGSKNKSSRIDVLREEIAAWDKALQFVQESNLPHDKDRWDYYSKKYIYQYARWTVNPKAFEDNE
jgi:hypothetical protein